MNENVGRYIEQHLEPENTDRETTERAIARLDKPLASIEYRPEGENDIEANDLSLRFSYRQPTTQDHLEKVLDLGVLTESNEWRLLDSLKLLDKGENVIFDLMEDLPEFKILFRPDTNGPAQSAANPEKKYLIIRGDISQPRAIIALLHEVGHCKDYEKLDDHDKETFESGHKALHMEGQVSRESLEKVLRRERNAWAYALKNIKPILGRDISKADVKQYIHNYALGSYSEGMRKKIEEGLVDFDWSEILT
jgi:hypothetical protein